MLQILAKCYFERKAFDAELKTFLSRIVSDMDGVISGQEVFHSESFTREDLQMCLEEADVRVIPHIHKAVSNGVERVVVLSNDTDVVVLLLFYIFDFFSLGLKECWIRVGTGENKVHSHSHAWKKARLLYMLCSYESSYPYGM